jgi:hypothetical protein
MHMLHYEGEPFDADIGNKLIRRNLIAEIAATLVPGRLQQNEG